MDRDMFYDYVVRAMVLIVSYETGRKTVCHFRSIIKDLIYQLGISNGIEAEEIPEIIGRAEDLAEEIIRDNVE
jgi:hypothetical protein